jgi:hypothetical protein
MAENKLVIIVSRCANLAQHRVLVLPAHSADQVVIEAAEVVAVRHIDISLRSTPGVPPSGDCLTMAFLKKT